MSAADSVLAAQVAEECDGWRTAAGQVGAVGAGHRSAQRAEALHPFWLLAISSAGAPTSCIAGTQLWLSRC